MPRSKVTGSQANAHRGIPEPPKVAPHCGHPSPHTVAGVLCDDPPGPEFVDDAEELAPQPGLFSVLDSGASAGGAEVLAGEAAANNVCCLCCVIAHLSNVGEALRGGPMLREDFAAKALAFRLPHDGAEPRASEPELKPADP